jgi:hypothetical protein
MKKFSVRRRLPGREAWAALPWMEMTMTLSLPSRRLDAVAVVDEDFHSWFCV